MTEMDLTEQIEALTDKTIALADALDKQAKLLQAHHIDLQEVKVLLDLLTGGKMTGGSC